MGQFAVVITGTGNHGCSRDVGDGGQVLGCQRPDCVDCIAREFTRRFKRNGVYTLQAELVHWPNMTVEPADGQEVVAGYVLVVPQESTVRDDLVTGTRHGSF